MQVQRRPILHVDQAEQRVAPPPGPGQEVVEQGSGDATAPPRGVDDEPADVPAVGGDVPQAAGDLDEFTRAVVALPVATIADKCVWTADESAIYCGIPTNPSASYAYPDDWYQGAISFNDRIWKIDVAGRLAQLTLDFSTTAKQSLDAEALSIDPLGKELVFVNKIDGSLWAYQL